MTARKPNSQKTKPVKIGATPQIIEYLQQLVGRGLYGKTPTEVASNLVSKAIESLIERGHLEAIHKSRKDDDGQS